MLLGSKVALFLANQLQYLVIFTTYVYNYCKQPETRLVRMGKQQVYKLVD